MATARTNLDDWRWALPSLAELGRDLTHVSARQRWATVAVPFLCVGAYVFFACLELWIPAVIAVAGYTFVSYGSSSHDLVHGNLGLPRWLDRTMLSLIELLGLRSGHAYRVAHLHHHQRFPEPDDVEGMAAHGSLIKALLLGPVQQPLVCWWALRRGGRDRIWIVLEVTACIALGVAALATASLTLVPLIYVVLVVLGSWTFPLITSYMPHVPDGANELTRTRRFRGTVARVVFAQHLYHLEHHLYPGIPHHHWASLAKRLDPYLDRAGVDPVYFGF